MDTRRLLLIVCALSLALLAACDGGGSSPSATETPEASPTPAGTTVASDDGKLSLFIPEGAMPAGTDVSITSVAHDQLPVELSQLVGSGTGYRLEPDGLTFSQPATATLTIDRSELDDPEGTQSAYALVSFNETAGREVLDSDTTATVGESTVTVTAQLQHLSFITKTDGSLKVQLDVVPRRQVVGRTFLPVTAVSNTRRDRVLLGSVRGAWLAFDVVSWDGPEDLRVRTGAFDAVNELAAGGGAIGFYVCARPGLGGYAVSVSATSTLIDESSPATSLVVTLTSDVECVPEGAAEPSATSGVAPPDEATPTSTPPGEILLYVTSIGGCRHIRPGESQNQHKPRVTNIRTGGAVIGATVEGEATGPALINDTASAVTDANGEALLIYGITAYGVYNSRVVRITLADGTVPQIDPSSVTEVTYNVGQTCTPP